MDCDMVVALSRATQDGSAILGHNCNRPYDEPLTLVRRPGCFFPHGERVLVNSVILPQARQIHTALACRSGQQWGYWHGVNDRGVALGLTEIRTQLEGERAGLRGTDLVRLGLERAGSAVQAVDILTDLAGRHGQHCADGAGGDSSLLIADAREAFLVQMCGPHWVVQEVRQTRVATAACDIRQDWDRISHGLADLAIDHGWWPGNGSKLDFTGAVGKADDTTLAAMRRWGRATVLLEQHNGRIDVPFLRGLLADHLAAESPESPSPTSLCRHPSSADPVCTSASMVVHLPPVGQGIPIAWWAFGPPCASVYFPLLPVGELPLDFQADTLDPMPGSPLWRRFVHWSMKMADDPLHTAVVCDNLARMQERFDQDVRDFLAEAAEAQRRGESDRLPRLAEVLMQYHVECFDGLWPELAPHEAPVSGALAFSGMYVG